MSLGVSQLDATGETSMAGAAAITFTVSAIDASGIVRPAGTGSVAFGSEFADSGIVASPIMGTGAVAFAVPAISGYKGSADKAVRADPASGVFDRGQQ